MVEMKNFLKTLIMIIVGIFNTIKYIVNMFTKAVNIIKPKGLLEWIILFIAVPIPFGVTALFIYKYYKHKD